MGPSSAGRQKRSLRSAHKEIKGLPRHSGKRRPCRDGGGGEIARCLACARKGDRAFNIDPPASSYAIMRRARPTAERTVGPARIVEESLTPRPGIREQHRCEVPECPPLRRSWGTSRHGADIDERPHLTPRRLAPWVFCIRMLAPIAGCETRV